jgi:hypothetical protein
MCLSTLLSSILRVWLTDLQPLSDSAGCISRREKNSLSFHRVIYSGSTVHKTRPFIVQTTRVMKLNLVQFYPKRLIRTPNVTRLQFQDVIYIQRERERERSRTGSTL